MIINYISKIDKNKIINFAKIAHKWSKQSEKYDKYTLIKLWCYFNVTNLKVKPKNYKNSSFLCKKR